MGFLRGFEKWELFEGTNMRAPQCGPLKQNPLPPSLLLTLNPNHAHAVSMTTAHALAVAYLTLFYLSVSLFNMVLTLP